MRRKLPDDMGRGALVGLWWDLRTRRVVSWPGGGGTGRGSGRRGGRRWGSWRTGGNGDQQTAAVSCFCHSCSAWNEVAPLKEQGKLENCATISESGARSVNLDLVENYFRPRKLTACNKQKY